MTKSPQAQRKRRFETASGYKLRGAMVWVVIGIACGLAGALIATGLSMLWTKISNWNFTDAAECPERAAWSHAFDAFNVVCVFIAVAVLLYFARRSVQRRAVNKYGEFADDVGDWFGFGALIAYGTFGVPLLLVAVFTNLC